MPTGPQQQGSRVRAGFGRLLTASTVTNIGDGMSAVAYPWLASALTRHPLLIALVAVAQRLPWLVLSLPAGVITDRVDRRRLIVRMDLARGAITACIAMAVLARSGALPGPGAVVDGATTDLALYTLLVLATLLLGSAEVLRDNSAQTLMPAIIDGPGLERANGRIWAAESAANQFIGPPLGSLLIGISFALPFVIDAATFFAAAGLVATIPGSFRPVTSTERQPWRDDLSDGIRWLRSHQVLWPMAIVLGIMNGSGALAEATLVIFAQEVLAAGPFLFAVIGAGGAIGSIVGGWLVPRVSGRLGGGRVLVTSVAGIGLCSLAVGLTSSWVIVMLAFSVTAMLGLGWNVVTVSLRQSVIPDHLLGRVNSVYRFMAWGSIPVGALAGGTLVALLDGPLDRSTALRAPWILSAVIHISLLSLVLRRLSTAALDSIRPTAATAKQ